MDYISVKDDSEIEYQRSMESAKYLADNTTSGGLNNEGMQYLLIER